jgi:hypothetical protein
VIYALPLAGYVILYSDYFQSLFKFSSLTSGGFLTFSQRADSIYYGSLFLLIAYGLWWASSPRLLRGKRDLQQFVSDIVVARDRSTAIQIVRSPPFTPEESVIFSQTLPVEERAVFVAVSSEVKARGALLGDGAGEYEHRIPTALGFYFKWQNATWPILRAFIGGLALLGFFLVLIPSLDLLIRVLGTHYHRLFT